MHDRELRSILFLYLVKTSPYSGPWALGNLFGTFSGFDPLVGKKPIRQKWAWLLSVLTYLLDHTQATWYPGNPYSYDTELTVWTH